jgi:hypothetical protein
LHFWFEFCRLLPVFSVFSPERRFFFTADRHTMRRTQSFAWEDSEMPKLLQTALWLVFALSAFRGYGEDLPPPSLPPDQLVREVVYNEQHDHQQHGYWRYWIARRAQNQTMLEQQVETTGGPITLVTLANGRPLSGTALQQEQAQLNRLLVSPQEQARHLRQYGQDEARVGRILAMLPDAFLFEYDGQENGCYRLRFRPNPSYPTHSTEGRVFHAMTGTLLVDARYKRLAGLEGRVGENVDFGFGLLGRLYKGGWFRLERVRVSPTDWKTERLEMHMNIRALLITSFSRETSEVRGGFTPVPTGMSVAQGIALLERARSEQAAQALPPAGVFAFNP